MRAEIRGVGGRSQDLGEIGDLGIEVQLSDGSRFVVREMDGRLVLSGSRDLHVLFLTSMALSFAQAPRTPHIYGNETPQEGE